MILLMQCTSQHTVATQVNRLRTFFTTPPSGQFSISSSYLGITRKTYIFLRLRNLRYRYFQTYGTVPVLSFFTIPFLKAREHYLVPLLISVQPSTGTVPYLKYFTNNKSTKTVELISIHCSVLICFTYICTLYSTYA
jgi:hypothetical protein